MTPSARIARHARLVGPCLALALGAVGVARADTFEAGSLIIPMSTTHQDLGMFTAHGLVHFLLENDVRIAWCIEPGKAYDGVDFVADATDLQSGAAVTDFGYAGGPFVVREAHATAALPLVASWQVAHPDTKVHVATAPFTAAVGRELRAAPTIAVLADTNEIIAFRYLNAAAITDSLGNAWPRSGDGTRVYAGWPDVLDPAEVNGTSLTDFRDGALHDADATPTYCQIMSMHYPSGTITDGEVGEVRDFLTWPTHAFMSCSAIREFENRAGVGHYLTTAGLSISGTGFSDLTYSYHDDPLAQAVGALRVDPGTVAGWTLAAGSAFHPNGVLHIKRASTVYEAWRSGHLDGDMTKGRLSWLGGHEYPTTVPVSANNQANGVRYFLNSLLDAPCTGPDGAPNLTVIKSAPARATGAPVTFTIDFSNAGPGVARRATLTDILPPGTTFVSATGGGVHVGGVVTWDLGNLEPGEAGSHSVTLTLDVALATYLNHADVAYEVGLNTFVDSSNTTTTRRCGPSADTDGDGVGEDCDNCPGLSNASQLDGDTDGVGDDCDNCPRSLNAGQEDGDGDGPGDACDDCPEVADPGQRDDDVDGVGDACDNCPASSNPGQQDRDADALGDDCDVCPDAPDPAQLDGDADGAGDPCDNCPSLSNRGQQDGDADGPGDACDNCPTLSNPGQQEGDADGPGDVCDNCPGLSNPGQQDRDADSVGDACDNCPDLSNVGQWDSDADGIGDACDCPPPSAGAGDDLMATSRTAFAFSPVAGAATYWIHRGAIPPRGGMGARSGNYDHDCFVERPTPDFDDSALPGVGAFYYLVAAYGCAPAPDGVGADSLGRPRPTPACP